jgi:hypothetical protein
MMIPGAWEPGRRTAAMIEPLTPAGTPLADIRTQSGPEIHRQHAELPSWLIMWIFAAALLVATWLAMAVLR